MQGIWNRLEKSSGAGQDWTGQGGFDIYFCVFFDCCCQSLISGGETGHWAMSPPKFEIFLIFPYFLNSKSEVVRHLVRQLVYQVCCTRYHVSFCLWLIGSVLKHCKVPKYYEQNCRFLNMSGLHKVLNKIFSDRCLTVF